MKALAIDRYGNAGTERLRDLPAPSPGPRDLLVDVHAASVNPVDFKTRSGKLKPLLRYSFPLVLGCDLSGVVAGVGADVTRFKPGDAVFARLRKDRIGAFAEQALVDEEFAARVPAGASHIEAASIPLAGLTAWQALFDVCLLSAGQKVLVTAGSGGVGTLAIQLAKHKGAHVATTVGARNADLAKRLGADVIIDYRTQRFDQMLSDYDAVFDTQGGETLERAFSVLKRGGRVVTVGGVPDPATGKTLGMNPVLVLALRIMTRKLTRLAREKDAHFQYLFMHPSGDGLATLGELMERRALVPVIDRTFTLDEARDALAYVEAGRTVGKVVIVVRP